MHGEKTTMARKVVLWMTLLALLMALAACGGSTTTDNGNESQASNANDIVATDQPPGDAETIGDTTGGPGNTTSQGEAVTESGSTPESGAASDASGMAAPAFLNDWQTAGATVVTGGEVPASLFEGASGQTYLVNDVELQVYEFNDAATAEAAAATISPDGGMINDSAVRWAGPPHFFRQDNLIIVYIGDDAATLDLLGGTFGTPFAGPP